MSFFRKIDVRVFGDEKFCELSAPKPCGRYLWFYLLSGKHTTALPGLSVIGEAGLAEALKWPLSGFRKAFTEIESRKMAKADWNAQVLWIPNVIKYNFPDSPNVVRSWARLWDLVPECKLKDEAAKAIASALALREAYLKAFREACHKKHDHPSPNQEQEQEQITPQPPGGGLNGKIGNGFERFRAAYPRKQKMEFAKRIWNSQFFTAEQVETIVGAVEIQAKSEQWTKQNGKFIPNPDRWLEGRCWEDVLPGTQAKIVDPSAPLEYAPDRPYPCYGPINRKETPEEYQKRKLDEQRYLQGGAV